MARTQRNAGLETRTARLRRDPRPKPYYVASGRKGVLLGYRRVAQGNGSWIVKRLIERTDTGGHYSTEKIAEADDYADSDGAAVLTYFEAMAKAGAELSEVQRRSRYTVADAVKDHVSWLQTHRKSAREDELKLKAYVTPYFGDRLLSDLTAQDFEKWLAWALAHKPKGRRSDKPKAPKPQPKRGMKAKAKTEAVKLVIDPDERDRRKRSTLNRVIASFKAALTRAYMNGHTASDQPWRRLKKFKGVSGARRQWLTTDQCTRLVNAAEPNFRRLLHAALLTGARWGELRAMKCGDYDPASSTVIIRQSKAGKSRRVYLTDDGKAAFEAWTAGRPESALIFVDASGNGWGDHDQHRPMAAACAAAKITPAVGFHILRHSYASALVQMGVSLAIVAEALGHRDTRMVSEHYGHLAPDHVADAIRANLPRLGVTVESNVTRIRG